VYSENEWFLWKKNKNNMNRILNILINPFFLSLVFTTVIILLLPPVFDKYNLELILKTNHEQEYDCFYDDLDGDGFSEQILIYANIKGYAMLYIRNHKGITINQWNFDHFPIPMPSRYYISDVNNDGKKEVFVFTFHNDSIFLNAVDPLGTGTYLFQNRFITEVNHYKGKPDFSIKRSDFADLNSDSYKEIIFAINAGFALFPRKLFAYDYKNDSLLISVECGNILSEINAIDINDDGYPEIITNTWSSRNYTDPSLSVQFHDTFMYLMVFDNTLDFFFPPVQYKYSIGDMINQIIKIQDENYILSLHNISGQSKFNTSLQLNDNKGKLIKKVSLHEVNSPISVRYGIPHIVNNLIIVTAETGEVFYYNYDLELITKKRLPIKDLVYPNYKFMDLNADGQDEVITFDSEKRMIIADKNLKHLVNYKFGSEQYPLLSLKYNGEASPELVAIAGKKIWFFNYKFNPLYYWHYPIYAAIFLFILIINLMIQKIQKAQIKTKFQTRQEITELQLKTIRNQMEPHFTFNAINSIASVLYDGDKELAYQYFTKISKLIRATLEDADKISRTLSAEIEFITNYLEIQKFRFTNKFDYEVIVGELVNPDWKIPKMLIQIYAENAVKHGLVHKMKKGILTIELRKEDDYLIVEVEDDGIGREKAKEIGSRSSGKGQQIMQQYYSLFNKTSKDKIENEIIDLKDKDGNASGTKIIIKIPIS